MTRRYLRFLLTIVATLPLMVQCLHYELGGTKDDFMMMTEMMPSTLTEFTFSTWFKVTQYAHKNTMIAYSKDSSYGNTLRVQIRNSTHINVYVNEQVNTGTYFDYPPPGVNTWSQLAVSWRQTDGDLRLYLDGVLVDQQTLLPLVPPVPPGGCVYFGNDLESDCDASDFTDSEAFTGSVGDVQLFSRVLTPGEVSELYARCSVVPCGQSAVVESLSCRNTAHLCGEVVGCGGPAQWAMVGNVTQVGSCYKSNVYVQGPGRLRGAALDLQVADVRSDVSCGVLCDQTTTCRGFNYDHLTAVCHLVDVLTDLDTSDPPRVHWYK